MRLRLAALLAAGLLLAAPAFAAGDGASPACPVPATAGLAAPLRHIADDLAAGNELRVVAIGSSSTAGAGATDPAHSYPARLAHHLRQWLPGVTVTVLNRGVNGETDPDMLRRFQQDVLDLRPDLVVWQVGANAVLRGEDLAADEAFIRDGVQRLTAVGLDVILMDLQYAPAILAKPGHADMVARIARVAAEQKVGLFPRFALMQHWVQSRQASMADLVGPDGLHQNDFGYDCIARTLATAIREAGRTTASP